MAKCSRGNIIVGGTASPVHPHRTDAKAYKLDQKEQRRERPRILRACRLQITVYEQQLALALAHERHRLVGVLLRDDGGAGGAAPVVAREDDAAVWLHGGEAAGYI